MQQDSTDNIKSYHFVWTETKKSFYNVYKSFTYLLTYLRSLDRVNTDNAAVQHLAAWRTLGHVK